MQANPSLFFEVFAKVGLDSGSSSDIDSDLELRHSSMTKTSELQIIKLYAQLASAAGVVKWDEDAEVMSAKLALGKWINHLGVWWIEVYWLSLSVWRLISALVLKSQSPDVASQLLYTLMFLFYIGVALTNTGFDISRRDMIKLFNGLFSSYTQLGKFTTKVKDQ